MWPGATWNPAFTQLPMATSPVAAAAALPLPNYPALTLPVAAAAAASSLYQPTTAYSWKCAAAAAAAAQDNSSQTTPLTVIGAPTSMHTMLPIHPHIPVFTDKETIVIQ